MQDRGIFLQTSHPRFTWFALTIAGIPFCFLPTSFLTSVKSALGFPQADGNRTGARPGFQSAPTCWCGALSCYLWRLLILACRSMTMALSASRRACNDFCHPDCAGRVPALQDPLQQTRATVFCACHCAPPLTRSNKRWMQVSARANSRRPAAQLGHPRDHDRHRHSAPALPVFFPMPHF